MLPSLPPYSPDLIPIERAFVKIKATPHKIGARPREALGSVRSRAKMRQSHKGWCLTDVGEPLHLVGWRET